MKVSDQKSYFTKLYTTSIKPFLPPNYSARLEVGVVHSSIIVLHKKTEVVGKIPVATCFGLTLDQDVLVSLILLSAGVMQCPPHNIS